MKEIYKHYNPKQIEIETECYKHLIQKKNNKSIFVIMLPPPNMTGDLHMGHAFQQTLMDILIRYNRMLGKETLFQPGIDHAGIATQLIVEKKLNLEGFFLNNLGRNNFIEKVLEYKHKTTNTINIQMRRLGISCDWDRSRFTLDKEFSYAVKYSFIKLYEDGLIYRGKRLVNWDPMLLTAISDLEVVESKEKGCLWYFNYPINDDFMIPVATTRPETILGDVALAVHPEDKRYKDFIGQSVKLPLSNRTIPIIGENTVEKTFGTGCVKITPGHDFKDYEIAKKHNLPIINILTKTAKINGNVFDKKYKGLDRLAARKIIIEDMQEKGLFIKKEHYEVTVLKSDRTGSIIEPYLTEQWFIKTQELANTTIELVEQNKISFFPDKWKNTYFSWMKDVKDWCISRQLWWGHQIPAWYDDQGNIYVADSEKDVRKKYNLSLNKKLTQDQDVFDTWFSSAIWPFATLGWPINKYDIKKYYPTSVLVTGFDIIFFWVARMIMFGMYFIKQIPFHDIYITGLIRDNEGKKMSKSKGNGLDPIDFIDGISLTNLIKKRTKFLINKTTYSNKKIEKDTKNCFPEGINAYGSDALRFTFCAIASSSRDIYFDIKRVLGYRNFCNKLWNASRFVISNMKGYNTTQHPKEMDISELWIWDKMNYTIKNVHKNIQEYRFDLLAKSLYEFIWNEYCDWYIEFAKVRLNDHNVLLATKQSVQYTLINILDNILRLSHPVIPFITDYLFSKIKPFIKNNNFRSCLPTFNKYYINKKASMTITWIKNIILEIRKIRAKLKIPSKMKIVMYIRHIYDQQLIDFNHMKVCIQSMCKISNFIIVNNNEDSSIPISYSFIVNNIECHIPLNYIIFIKDENMRLKHEYQNIIKELNKLQKQLNNKQFLLNAPYEIIQKNKEKMAFYNKNKVEIMKTIKLFSDYLDNK